MSVSSRMSLARLGVEADELEMGMVTLKPDESGDGWYVYCSNPPWPHVEYAPSVRGAFAKLIRWVAKRRKVYR